MADIPARLKLRAGTLAAWTTSNPVLLSGEPGFETDTKVLRIGDGVTAFLSLLPVNPPPAPEILPNMLIMWAGSVASIPAGWALCDGDNGTPDLRDKFIVGAGGAYAVADTGGAASVTLDATHIPTHAHGAGTLTTNSAGSHIHGAAGGGSFLSNVGGGGVTGISFIGPSNINTGNTDAAGTHAHSVTGSTGNAGSGGSHENRPPYYALCYIMKL